METTQSNLTWQQRNPERARELQRAWRKANPEKARQSCHRYARAHRKDVTARVRRWQLKQDPEAFKALQRQYKTNQKARRLLAATPASPPPGVDSGHGVTHEVPAH